MTKPLTCFIIMPFRDDFRPVRDMIREVVQYEIQATAIRADDIFRVGEIIDQVKEAIEHSDFCVADITDNNANVMWEVGYASALGKQVIALRQHTEDIPFDVRAQRVFTYDLTNLVAAKPGIVQAVKALARDIAIEPPPLAWRYDELSHLRDGLSRCQPTRRGRDLLAILKESTKGDGVGRWRDGEGERLMRLVAARTKPEECQSVFWWLIAHGVFSYNQIEVFQKNGSNGWSTNLELVELSGRGVALLNLLSDEAVP